MPSALHVGNGRLRPECSKLPKMPFDAAISLSFIYFHRKQSDMELPGRIENFESVMYDS